MIKIAKCIIISFVESFVHEINQGLYNGVVYTMGKPTMIRDLLKKLNKTFHINASREMAEIGITVPQWLVLRQIISEPRTIGQISKAIDLSYSTVSGIIDRLEREQFVERTRDEKDRRVIWIQKTDKINEIMEQVPFFSENYYNMLFKGFSDSELDTMIATLEMLIFKLEKES